MDGGLPERGLPGGTWRTAGGWRRLLAPRAADPVTRRNYELIQAARELRQQASGLREAASVGMEGRVRDSRTAANCK